MFVDDDRVYLEIMMGELEDLGFAVRGFRDGVSLFRELERGSKADVLVLDWTLPNLDVLSGVRHRGINVPIAFLAARALGEHEHIALTRGATDFIDKMRGVDVIARRLRRMIGSRRRLPPSVAKLEAPWICGPLSLRRHTPRIEWRGADVGLTLTENNVIDLLVTNAGRPQTYRAIYDTMHYVGFLAGSGTTGYQANVRVAIKRIRKKFLALDAAFAEIENHPGVGYSWRGPEQG